MYVVLEIFDNPTRASLICTMMENKGYRVHLKDEHIVSVNPLFSPAVGGIKLMVHSEDLERAKAYLLIIYKDSQ